MLVEAVLFVSAVPSGLNSNWLLFESVATVMVMLPAPAVPSGRRTVKLRGRDAPGAMSPLAGALASYATSVTASVCPVVAFTIVIRSMKFPCVGPVPVFAAVQGIVRVWPDVAVDGLTARAFTPRAGEGAGVGFTVVVEMFVI